MKSGQAANRVLAGPGSKREHAPARLIRLVGPITREYNLYLSHILSHSTKRAMPIRQCAVGPLFGEPFELKWMRSATFKGY